MKKRDSKGAYYSIINCFRLTDKEDFRKKIRKKTLAASPILLFNKNQKYVLPLFSILNKWTLYQKGLYKSRFFLFLRHTIQKQKNIFCTSEASLCFTQKKNFCRMNKIKLVWFYSLYRNYLKPHFCRICSLVFWIAWRKNMNCEELFDKVSTCTV